MRICLPRSLSAAAPTLLAGATLALLISGCAAITPPAATPAPAPAATSAPAAENPHAGHGSMNMAADTPFDAMFIDGMIVHHQGAIDMAELTLEEAEHAELRAMAEAIIAAQTGEIAQMQEWRTAWYPDLAPTDTMHMEMGQMSISEDAGKPFDQRFLEAMISHHQGAIDMAKMALEQSEHAEIRTLAEAIITAQEAEIAQMQSWLKEWYGVSQ